MPIQFLPMPTPTIMHETTGQVLRKKMEAKNLNFAGWSYEGALEVRDQHAFPRQSFCRIFAHATVHFVIKGQSESVQFRCIPWDTTLRVHRSPPAMPSWGYAQFDASMKVIEPLNGVEIPLFPSIRWVRANDGIKELTDRDTKATTVTLAPAEYHFYFYMSVEAEAEAFPGVTTTAGVRLGRCWFLANL